MKFCINIESNILDKTFKHYNKTKHTSALFKMVAIS